MGVSILEDGGLRRAEVEGRAVRESDQTRSRSQVDDRKSGEEVAEGARRKCEYCIRGRLEVSRVGDENACLFDAGRSPFEVQVAGYRVGRAID